jgi:NAD(P)-dependent dehydrogenase (short-subunit alcohol dehydrogenase family)
MGEPFWQDRRVWITGASSGIGWALTEELASRGARLAVSARRESTLRELAERCSGTEVQVHPLDVTDREATRGVCAELMETWGRVDSVLLNAGISELNEPGGFDAGSVRRVHEVNFLGNVYGIEASLPLMDRSDDPHLAGISSASAYGPLPTAGAYGSSKAAQKYLLESLQFDLEPRGIRVSVVCPGFVRTPLVDKNDFPMPFLMEPDQAAGRIADGLAEGRSEIHFPKPLTLAIKLVSKLPGPLYRWILNRVR